MDPNYCKHAKVKGEGTTWYYACELTGDAIDDKNCLSCEDRDAPEGNNEEE